MTLDEIKQAIAKLSPNELSRLRAWLAHVDASPSDPPDAEADTPATRLGRLAGRAVADFKKRIRDT